MGHIGSHVNITAGTGRHQAKVQLFQERSALFSSNPQLQALPGPEIRSPGCPLREQDEITESLNSGTDPRRGHSGAASPGSKQ